MPPPKVIFLDLKLCCLFCGGRLKVRGVRKFTVMNTRSKLREKLDQWTVFWGFFLQVTVWLWAHTSTASPSCETHLNILN